ncbi:MAG: FAD-binding protein [Sutterella wadsworthensis]
MGSGIAATCAANESIDHGAKRVIMVDKMPVFGGNSPSRASGSASRAARAQLAHGVKDDSPELFLKDTLKAGECFSDPKLAHALCFKALESFEYIRKLGCEFAPTPFIQGGHSKIRSLAPKVSAGISVMLPLPSLPRQAAASCARTQSLAKSSRTKRAAASASPSAKTMSSTLTPATTT